MSFIHPNGENLIIAAGVQSSNQIDDLHSAFRPVVVELIVRLYEARIASHILETKRSIGRHRLNVASGSSWLVDKLSKHCFGLAIDIVPEEVLKFSDWKPDAEVWKQIGKIGESLGLIWGGRWKTKDCAHFQASRLLRIQIDVERIILWE